MLVVVVVTDVIGIDIDISGLSVVVVIKVASVVVGIDIDISGVVVVVVVVVVAPGQRSVEALSRFSCRNTSQNEKWVSGTN